jgi:hypothetical protein
VPKGSNLPIAELFLRKYGMQAGTIVGSGSFVRITCRPTTPPALGSRQIFTHCIYVFQTFCALLMQSG